MKPHPSSHTTYTSWSGPTQGRAPWEPDAVESVTGMPHEVPWSLEVVTLMAAVPAKSV